MLNGVTGMLPKSHSICLPGTVSQSRTRHVSETSMSDKRPTSALPFVAQFLQCRTLRVNRAGSARIKRIGSQEGGIV